MRADGMYTASGVFDSLSLRELCCKVPDRESLGLPNCYQ